MSFEMSLFNAVALAEFKRIHPSLPMKHEELLDEVVNAFGVNDLSNAVEEAQRFSAWLPTWKLRITMPTIDGLNVGLQIKNGSGFVNMSLHASFGVDFGENSITETQASQRAINMASAQMLNQLFEAYDYLREATVLGQQATTDPTTASANVDGAESCMGDTLLIESKDGKTSYRIKGGKWSQWGAAVYPEVLRAAAIPFESLGMGSHVLGRMIHVVKNDRGYAKVIKID